MTRKNCLLTLLLIPSLFAWTEDTMGPEEPSIVLPTYILEIEDISTENVEAGLPDEEEMLPPERTPPLPTEGELYIEEADLEIVAPETGTQILGGGDTSFVIEGLLGAGSRHHLTSQFSLYQLGGDPRYKVLFAHEVLDGFGGNPAGGGFHHRRDVLSGSLRTSLGGLSVDLQGAFTDTDVGLQGRSIYTSRTLRTLEGEARIGWPLSDWFGLNVALDAHTASVFFTRTLPVWATEYVVVPTVEGILTTGPLTARLSLQYGLRALVNLGVPTVHRMRVALSAGVNLPAGLRATADVAWYQRFDGQHFVPFSVGVSGNPLESLRFHLGGGYRVDGTSFRDALEEYEFATPPAALTDLEGWTAEAGVQVTFMRVVVLSVDAALHIGSAMLTPSADVDSTQGLYTLSQETANELDGAAVLRWNITPSTYVSLTYDREFLDRPRHGVRDLFSLEFVGATSDGRLGGRFLGTFGLGSTPAPQLPLLGAEAYYRLSENVRILGEISDFLAPLSGGTRFAIGQFLEPGMRGSVTVHLSF